MNENAKLWVKELKSGRFKQGRGKLHVEKNDKHLYCCLGVACRLFMENGGQLSVSVDAVDPIYHPRTFEYEYDGNDGCLPNAVREWLGLRTTTGDFLGEFYHKDGYRADDLVILNDKCKLTFKQIARFIEKRDKDMFKEETNEPKPEA